MHRLNVEWRMAVGRVLFAVVTALAATGLCASEFQHPPSPDVLFGPLFAEVQRAHLFADQKTFADAVPLRPVRDVLSQYRKGRAAPGFDLRRFVQDEFALPREQASAPTRSRSIEDHLELLWDQLQRAPDRSVRGASLLPLPHPYVVPGGRFREVYYWDSYFTMLGLRVSRRDDLIRSMVDNFAHQLAAYGLIPNGNRTYYLSRSQPPFFALMVELLAETDGPGVLRRYRDALEREYDYWMDRTFPAQPVLPLANDGDQNQAPAPTRHVVEVPGIGRLNRYWDRRETPRPEAYATDESTAAAASGRSVGAVYRDLRSGAESGWDFSSRWFGAAGGLPSTETTQVVPVDLNALLHQLELTLAAARRADGDSPGGIEMERAAGRRREALLRACWSEDDGFFLDYDLDRNRRRQGFTLAGVTPLFLRIATPEQARAVARVVRDRFLRPGGVVTTLRQTGEQWDAPNGWAPLQWMTIVGLRNYGEHDLAREIAARWLRLNRQVFARTGRMMEKYNVEDLSAEAGGGEYPSQDGFGWTNGVFLALTAAEDGSGAGGTDNGVRE